MSVLSPSKKTWSHALRVWLETKFPLLVHGCCNVDDVDRHGFKEGNGGGAGGGIGGGEETRGFFSDAALQITISLLDLRTVDGSESCKLTES